MKTKKLLIRLAVLVCVLILAVAMFIVGRGHTIYVDNKTVEVEGETYSAFQRVEVYVNGERKARLGKRERGLASDSCMGQRFTMTLLVTKEKGDEPVEYVLDLALPYSWDGIVINAPAYLANLPQDVWMTEFVPAVQETTPEDEEIDTDEFNFGEG